MFAEPLFHFEMNEAGHYMQHRHAVIRCRHGCVTRNFVPATDRFGQPWSGHDQQKWALTLVRYIQQNSFAQNFPQIIYVFAHGMLKFPQ
jgi:hypothetical protein